MLRRAMSEALRTPEEALEGLPDFPFAAHYRELDGLRMAGRQSPRPIEDASHFLRATRHHPETARDQPRARNQSPVARVSRACSSGGSSPVAEFAARRS